MYSQYTKEQVKIFVGNYGSDIIAAITNKNLFFPAVVGQLTVESKFNTSGLSTKYNNFGGIKTTGSEFSNGKISLDTTEVVSGNEIPVKQFFATYPDFKNFMADYVRVLALPQYVAAGVYTATSPYNQVLAIGKGGYSTRDPQAYLTLAKGRVDACIDLFPWGKIDTAAVAPDAPPANPVSIGIGSIFDSINAALGSAATQIKPAA